MLADNFNYQVAAGLHRDRLAEAESIRRAAAARRAANSLREETLRNEKDSRSRDLARILRIRIGRQLIALGERMTA